MNGFYAKLIQVLCFFRVREVDDAGNGRCFPHPFVWKADPGIVVGARCIGKLFMELLDTPSPGLRSLLSRDRCYLPRWQKIQYKFW